MQEYIIIPERNVHRIPADVSDEEAAILDVEVYSGLRKPGIEKDCYVLIVGPGPAGLIALQLCKILGAGKVILAGTRVERLQLGKRLGADVTIQLPSENINDEVARETGGKGPDMVFEASGSAAGFDLAIGSVANKGKVVLYGIHGKPLFSANIDKIVLKDLVVYGAMSDRLGWENMIQWVAEGKLDLKALITHRFPLKDTKTAYEIVRDRREGAVKAVLFP